MLFTQLLLEDYLKWRPALFRAFCVATADAEPLVAAAARNCFHSLLMPRSPRLAFDGFVPLLFILNGCVDHPTQKATLDGRERDKVEMAGSAHQGRRLAILRGLLSKMSDEQRLQCTSKLCQEVLAAVPDGTLALDPATKQQPVLADALALLASREIKVSAGANKDGDDDDDAPPAAAASAAANAARGKLLTQVARKATVESIVPIVIELKRHLEGEHSPLLKDVFMFLRELLRDHKQHMQDILSRDRQLGLEIEFEMRKMQNVEKPMSERVSLSPGGRLSLGSNGAPGSAGGRTPTRRVPGSKSKAPAPSPDRLHGFSVPKLLRGKSTPMPNSASKLAAVAGNGVGRAPTPAAAAKAPGRAPTPAAALMAPPPPQRAASSPGPDVQMASPFKAPPPPRQWDVAPSPAKGLFDDIGA